MHFDVCCLRRRESAENTPAHEPAMERGIHAASASLFQATSKRHECRAPVQGFHARIVSGKSHLDPLPLTDEGRGNPIASPRRISAWVAEYGRIFPLPF